jgi:hypothetical protein
MASVSRTVGWLYVVFPYTDPVFGLGRCDAGASSFGSVLEIF